MTALTWFLVGLWVGGTAGFLLFAWMQITRDGERSADAAALREVLPPDVHGASPRRASPAEATGPAPQRDLAAIESGWPRT